MKLRKALSLFLAVIMVLSVIPMMGITAFADAAGYETVIYGDWRYYVNLDGGSTIDKYLGTKTSVEIPSKINGYTVTEIGGGAFYGCTSLTSVTIPNSVTSIGDYAFEDCTSLNSIIIPDSVTNIDSGAFSNTAYYNTESNWENNVLYIGNHLIEAKNSISGEYSIKSETKTIAGSSFFGCTSLTSVTIPDSVTSIGNFAFQGCKSLENVTIPNSVTSIGRSAFGDCTSLTSVTIPNSVTSIGGSAFKGCTSLTSITIPNSVTSIGEYTFGYCTLLTSVTIGNSVTSVDDCAFGGCTSLKSVTIPNSVKNIKYGAFEGCTSLTSITIPDSVTSIGSSAFDDTAYYNTEPNWKNGVLYIGNHLIRAKENISGKYAIKNGTKTIAGDAFFVCTSLTSVMIPNSVTSIGDSAFSGCTSLKSITIPDSVTSISWSAFRDCTSLTSVIIPDSVISIDDYAFFGCTSLKSITIPDSVTSIGYQAFYGCTSLTSVTIPNSVTSIDDSAFNGCTSLTSVTIPNSVTSIGYFAFDDCDNLKIYGNSGSYAETYAKENSIPFVVTGMAAPRLSKIANSAKGVTVSWSKISGATSYNVYRKAGNATSWTKVASVTGTAYTDSKVSSGTKYTYTVRAVNGSDMSGFDAKGISILRLAQPTFKVDNQNGYVRVAWNKVAGATGYYVYRKAPNAKSWTRIATVTGTAYADKNVKSGTNYVYTVRAYNGNVSSSFHSGVAIKYLARPTFKVANQNGYVRVAWNKVAGATGYYVYRKAPNAKSWTRIATVTGTAYNDKNVKSGSNYVYTVRAFNGKFTSTFHSGLAIKYLARPTFKVANKSNNVTVAWSKVAGANGYYVYRKAGNATSWTKVATVTGTAYADKNVKKNIKYTYTVKAYNGKYTSTYHSGAGVKH